MPVDETLGLPAYRHYRLLARIHQPGIGQLSTALTMLDDNDKAVLRRPHPEVLQILDPRPLLDDAAAIGAAYNSAGLLVCETLAAALTHNRQLWFGKPPQHRHPTHRNRRRSQHHNPHHITRPKIPLGNPRSEARKGRQDNERSETSAAGSTGTCKCIERETYPAAPDCHHNSCHQPAA